MKQGSFLKYKLELAFFLFVDIKFILTRKKNLTWICLHKYQIFSGILLPIIRIFIGFLLRKSVVHLWTLFKKLLRPKSCYRSGLSNPLQKVKIKNALKKIGKYTQTHAFRSLIFIRVALSGRREREKGQ